MGLALDEPEENDKVMTINEITVAIDSDIEPYTGDLSLEFDQARNGLVLRGNDYC
jgi:Fe-S cluster assembly iron-binding protein IscA